jgi:hypothetical protein
MTRSARIAVAAALLLGGTSSLATAKMRWVTSPPTAPDPYYRLSDSYYSYSDPYRRLYDFYAVPPYNPGYSYGHVRPGGWR